MRSFLKKSIISLLWVCVFWVTASFAEDQKVHSIMASPSMTFRRTYTRLVFNQRDSIPDFLKSGSVSELFELTVSESDPALSRLIFQTLQKKVGKNLSKEDSSRILRSLPILPDQTPKNPQILNIYTLIAPLLLKKAKNQDHNPSFENALTEKLIEILTMDPNLSFNASLNHDIQLFHSLVFDLFKITYFRNSEDIAAIIFLMNEYPVFAKKYGHFFSFKLESGARLPLEALVSGLKSSDAHRRETALAVLSRYKDLLRTHETIDGDPFFIQMELIKLLISSDPLPIEFAFRSQINDLSSIKLKQRKARETIVDLVERFDVTLDKIHPLFILSMDLPEKDQTHFLKYLEHQAMKTLKSGSPHKHNEFTKFLEEIKGFVKSKHPLQQKALLVDFLLKIVVHLTVRNNLHTRMPQYLPLVANICGAYTEHLEEDKHAIDILNFLDDLKQILANNPINSWLFQGILQKYLNSPNPNIQVEAQDIDTSVSFHSQSSIELKPQGSDGNKDNVIQVQFGKRCEPLLDPKKPDKE